MGICMQEGAGVVPSTGSVQGVGGCGGRKRRSPTGGAAKGIAWNTVVEPCTVPVTGPYVVLTTGAVRGVCAA